MVPQPHGGALKVGAGGGPQPGAGRPPNVFRDLMKRLRESPELAKSLAEALADPECKGFPHALKAVTDYDEDKPAEKKQIVGPIEVRVKIEREGRRITAS